MGDRMFNILDQELNIVYFLYTSGLIDCNNTRTRSVVIQIKLQLKLEIKLINTYKKLFWTKSF